MELSQCEEEGALGPDLPSSIRLVMPGGTHETIKVKVLKRRKIEAA
jgi:hypothetical protein